jgi:hypothetical protein
LSACIPGNHPKLRDARRAESQDDDRTQNHGKEQGDRQRQVTMEDDERELDALEVLKDEEED